MPRVEHQRAVAMPAGLLTTTLTEVLSGITEQTGAWRDFALHLHLRDIGFPDVGYVAIPIRLKSHLKASDSGQTEIELRIEAAQNPNSFPVFEGRCGTNAVSASRANVWLAGTYTVPLRTFGAFFDATLLHGAASRCLENFLDDIITASKARIEDQEQEFMRYHLLGGAR